MEATEDGKWTPTPETKEARRARLLAEERARSPDKPFAEIIAAVTAMEQFLDRQ